MIRFPPWLNILVGISKLVEEGKWDIAKEETSKLRRILEEYEYYEVLDLVKELEKAIEERNIKKIGEITNKIIREITEIVAKKHGSSNPRIPWGRLKEWKKIEEIMYGKG